MKVDVAFLPKDIAQGDLSGTVCIVLDVFRATTSIVTAIANGCEAIVPVVSLEKAHEAAKKLGTVLMAGERKSIKIDGFDFGNSPFEFSSDKVKNQQIVMTTTNGTVAIQAATGAFYTLIGSFNNAEAVCRKAQAYGKNILIVCAGTDRTFSLEDSLCAGLLVEILSSSGQHKVELNDAARGAGVMYQAAKDHVVDVAIQSRNGQRLVELAKESEVEYCLRKNIVNVVPAYKDHRIVLAE